MADVPAWPVLLERVGRSYTEADRHRYLLDRSQGVASRERGELHEQLAASQAHLASLFSRSSDWVWGQDASLRFNDVWAHTNDVGDDLASPLGGKHARQDPEVVDETEAARLAASVAARATSCASAVSRCSRPAASMASAPTSPRPHGPSSGCRSRVRYDALTGVANRSTFAQQPEQALNRARRAGGSLAVFFIDLDRFKAVNDDLGHSAGDELLKVVAQRLTGRLRGADIVGRQGGDEFMVLLDGNPDAITLSKIAGHVLTEMAEPPHLAGQPVQVSGRVGMRRFPDGGDDAATLLKCADSAMYLSKGRGKSNFQFFTAQVAERTALHLSLEGELRQAIQNSGLRLHYQPKLDVRTGALLGIEALVLWQHPQRGMLAPGEFIALAGGSGLIVPLGRWVVVAACQQLRSWRDAGLDAACFSVSRLGSLWAGCRQAGDRSHRKRADDRPQARSALAEAAARAGRAHRLRRPRHRPFVAGLPEAVSRADAQARSLVRRRPASGPRQRRDHARRDLDGAQPGHAGHGRRRGNALPAQLPG
ncbi:MAG: hypothetical protein RL227_641 [Pseudomonadota bacterium]